jgi:hypothetical protein
MKKPTSLEDLKAYAFGFATITVLFFAPFAIVSLLNSLLR